MNLEQYDQHGDLERLLADAPAPDIAFAVLTAPSDFETQLLEAVHFKTAERMFLERTLTRLALPRYSKTTLEPFRVWIEDNRWRLEQAGMTLPAPKRLERAIVFHVGQWLKAFSLRQERIGSHNEQTYVLTVESLLEVFQ